MTFLENIIGGMILQVHAYMEETGRTGSFERFPYLEILAVRAADNTSLEQNPEEGESRGFSAQNREVQQERYRSLLDKLSAGREDEVLTTAVNLALAATLVSEFGAYLNYYTGNRATLQLAYELCGEFYPDYTEIKKRWRLLERVLIMEKKNPLCYSNMEADHELLSYLSGTEEGASGAGAEDGIERFYHQDELHPMYVREALADEGAGLLKQGDVILQLGGRGGRRFLVKQIARRMEKDVLFVRADRICGDEEYKERRLMRMLHEAFLDSCMVCMYEEDRETPQQGEAEEGVSLLRAVRIFSEAGIALILCMENVAGIPAVYGIEEAAGTGKPGMRKTVRMELTPLSRAERACVWRGFAEQYHLQEDVEQCSIRYRMNADEIARAVKEWESSRTQQLSDICYRILLSGGTQKLGTVIRPSVKRSDLIVSERIGQTLGEICCGAAQGYRIYEEWGLDGQYPYGRNVSVLLAGAPGTGKTMTAHVLAHEIGVPLYQVELSHIMDKYIGETEKHLEQVFDFAAKTNMVLFFDEADALFAKRGEVTEGKDRYANMEVSYLLQRMEQFDGMVILATNFYHHIDKAFLRRIKYVLKYQEPDEAMRRRMWESCLVPSLPRETIDTDYLARQFSLSGGVIKNVIQSACIAAVYEKRPLCMVHLLRAVRMEYEKLDRSVTPELWGEYAYLMEQDF